MTHENPSRVDPEADTDFNLAPPPIPRREWPRRYILPVSQRRDNTARNIVLAGLAGLGILVGGVLIGRALASGSDYTGNQGGISSPSPYSTPTELATPTPSQAAGSPSPEATNGINLPPIGDTQLSAGQCAEANPGDIAEGDITINGVVQYDNDGSTGLITVFDQSAQVCAPFGGDLQRVGNSPYQAAWIANDRQQMTQHGCDNSFGCTIVTVRRWPSGQEMAP